MDEPCTNGKVYLLTILFKNHFCGLYHDIIIIIIIIITLAFLEGGVWCTLTRGLSALLTYIIEYGKIKINNNNNKLIIIIVIIKIIYKNIPYLSFFKKRASLVSDNSSESESD